MCDMNAARVINLSLIQFVLFISQLDTNMDMDIFLFISIFYFQMSSGYGGI